MKYPSPALVVLALASCSLPDVRPVTNSNPRPLRAPVHAAPAPQAAQTAPSQVTLAPKPSPLAAEPQTAAPAAPSLTEAETAKNRARPYADGLAALEQFRTSTGCDDPHAQEVLDCIADLRKDVELFHTVGSFPQYEREQRDRHTGLAFAFADEALKRDCLDAADRVYRDIFSFYVGATWSGIRDRAKLGIEDVRARRAQGGGALAGTQR